MERSTSRATLTVNGATPSLRRVSASRNCDELMPMLRRNSCITPEAAVSFVKGRAISSKPYVLLNSIQRENRESGDSVNPKAQDWNGSHRRKLSTELA